MRRILWATGTLALVRARAGCSHRRPSGPVHTRERSKRFHDRVQRRRRSQGVEDDDEREGSFTGNLRLGYAVRPDLVIHFEGTWLVEDLRHGVRRRHLELLDRDGRVDVVSGRRRRASCAEVSASAPRAWSSKRPGPEDLRRTSRASVSWGPSGTSGA